MPIPLKTRILIADDFEVVRSGLKLVLDAEPDLQVVAEASDGAEAVTRALEDDIDLAILDISMPRKTGLQAAQELTRRRPELRILILTMHDNEQYFFEALKAGASGYVLKAAPNRDLVEACRAAMRGEPFLYPAAVTALIRDYLDRASRGEADARGPAHPPRAGGGQAHRRGPHQRGDRRAAGHQQEDGRSPPREHPREARDAQPRRADALCHPPRTRRTLNIVDARAASHRRMCMPWPSDAHRCPWARTRSPSTLRAWIRSSSTVGHAQTGAHYTLRAWLEHQAAELSAGPGIRRTTVVDLTTPSTGGPREHGWLLDCELVDAAGPPSDALRELLTDMRLVGFDPIVFMAQPGPV